MSFEPVVNSSADQVSRFGIVNEMQREDFLALVSALRQFNAFQPEAAMPPAQAQYVSESYGNLASA